MNRFYHIIIFTLALLLISCFDEGTAVAPETGTNGNSTSENKIDYSLGHAMNQRLGRGINLGNAFDAECFKNCAGSLEPECTQIYHREDWSSCWSNPIRNEYYDIIKEAGFESIRLPVRWGEKAPNTPPYTILPSFMAQVKAEVQKIIAHGFPVIINVHHYNELYGNKSYTSQTTKEVQLAKLNALWEQISIEFKEFPDDMLVLEILNEPRSPMTLTDLNQAFADIWPIIRKHNPHKTIMVNPMNWGNYTAIKNITLPADGNVIASGHIYDPHEFTHQGSQDQYPIGVSWGTKTEVNDLRFLVKKGLDEITAAFPGADGGTIPLNIGEFGAHNSAELADRVLYTAVVREEAERYGMSWHYWAFTRVNFDAWQAGTQAWIPEILQALQPTQ